MGYYADFTIFYAGPDAEPVLEWVLTNVDWNCETSDADDHGMIAYYQDASVRQEELIDALAPIAADYDCTFKIRFEDQYSEGPYVFYVGADEAAETLNDHFETLQAALKAINACTNEAILAVSHKDEVRHAYLLNALDTLDVLLRTPTEPVLK